MSSITVTTPPAEVDARLPRFMATFSAAVLATALAVSAVNPRVAAAILAAQAIVFAIGALWGPLRNPYGLMVVSRLRGEVPACCQNK